MRLFTFYFSDQVGILLSLLEIKAMSELEYYNDISWIDINTSPIINIDESLSPKMWYPKGMNFKKAKK